MDAEAVGAFCGTLAILATAVAVTVCICCWRREAARKKRLDSELERLLREEAEKQKKVPIVRPSMIEEKSRSSGRWKKAKKSYTGRMAKYDLHADSQTAGDSGLIGRYRSGIGETFRTEDPGSRLRSPRHGSTFPVMEYYQDRHADGRRNPVPKDLEQADDVYSDRVYENVPKRRRGSDMPMSLDRHEFIPLRKSSSIDRNIPRLAAERLANYEGSKRIPPQTDNMVIPNTSSVYFNEEPPATRFFANQLGQGTGFGILGQDSRYRNIQHRDPYAGQDVVGGHGGEVPSGYDVSIQKQDNTYETVDSTFFDVFDSFEDGDVTCVNIDLDSNQEKLYENVGRYEEQEPIYQNVESVQKYPMPFSNTESHQQHEPQYENTCNYQLKPKQYESIDRFQDDDVHYTETEQYGKPEDQHEDVHKKVRKSFRKKKSSERQSEQKPQYESSDTCEKELKEYGASDSHEVQEPSYIKADSYQMIPGSRQEVQVHGEDEQSHKSSDINLRKDNCYEKEEKGDISPGAIEGFQDLKPTKGDTTDPEEEQPSTSPMQHQELNIQRTGGNIKRSSPRHWNAQIYKPVSPLATSLTVQGPSPKQGSSKWVCSSYSTSPEREYEGKLEQGSSGMHRAEEEFSDTGGSTSSTDRRDVEQQNKYQTENQVQRLINTDETEQVYRRTASAPSVGSSPGCKPYIPPLHFNRLAGVVPSSSSPSPTDYSPRTYPIYPQRKYTSDSEGTLTARSKPGSIPDSDDGQQNYTKSYTKTTHSSIKADHAKAPDSPVEADHFKSATNICPRRSSSLPEIQPRSVFFSPCNSEPNPYIDMEQEFLSPCVSPREQYFDREGLERHVDPKTNSIHIRYSQDFTPLNSSTPTASLEMVPSSPTASLQKIPSVGAVSLVRVAMKDRRKWITDSTLHFGNDSSLLNDTQDKTESAYSTVPQNRSGDMSPTSAGQSKNSLTLSTTKQSPTSSTTSKLSPTLSTSKFSPTSSITSKYSPTLSTSKCSPTSTNNKYCSGTALKSSPSKLPNLKTYVPSVVALFEQITARRQSLAGSDSENCT